MSLQTSGSNPSLRKGPLAQRKKRFIKRAFDLVFSGLFLCTLFPILYVIVGLAVKLSSSGPVLFRQRRVGGEGKEFLCYKFRSMYVNTECDVLQVTEHDSRVTRIGNFLRRTSIDELPQFINVFKGDMSVVGPRPHMLKHNVEFGEMVDNYPLRHQVKPGITGWAQVNGFRGPIRESWQLEGRVEHDIWYIGHWTFRLDLYIIWKTMKTLLCKEKNIR